MTAPLQRVQRRVDPLPRRADRIRHVLLRDAKLDPAIGQRQTVFGRQMVQCRAQSIFEPDLGLGRDMVEHLAEASGQEPSDGQADFRIRPHRGDQDLAREDQYLAGPTASLRKAQARVERLLADVDGR